MLTRAPFLLSETCLYVMISGMIVFDGVSFAKKMEENLKLSFSGLKLRLVIVMYKPSESSLLYVKKKKEFGDRVGVEVEVIEVDSLEMLLIKLNQAKLDDGVTGVMVQLPLDGVEKEKVEQVLSLIPLEKDVDGLNPELVEGISRGEDVVVPATVKAIGKVMDQAVGELEKDIFKLKIAVVGSRGMVGRSLVAQLKRFTFAPVEIDEGDELSELVDCDIVVSATGKSGLIKPDMVKGEVIVIDVGSPKPDFDEGVKKKAAFFTPVPGGVGPVTVASLFENLLYLYEER